MTYDVTRLYTAVDIGDDWEFGRELALGRYMVPGYAQVKEGAIEWTLHTADPERQRQAREGRISEAVQWSEPTRGLLDRFVRLRLDRPKAVCKFVESWGVLIPGEETHLNETTGFESLGLWKALQSDLINLMEGSAKEARDREISLALVTVVEDRDTGLLGLEIAGTATFDGYEAEPSRLLHWPTGRFSPARVASMYVEALLAARRPGLVFHPEIGMQVRMTGLSAALALQLGDVLLGRSDTDQAAGKTIAFCTGCSGPVSRRRAPSPGQAVWCASKACNQESWRRRKQRQRAKG